MTHGGLEGEDFLDFSATFVYMLCEWRPLVLFEIDESNDD